MTEPKVARDAQERGEGICRTCLAPIWNEGGTIGRRKRDTGWSDRNERGGDSLVCFQAVEYRHVPLTGREAQIFDVALARGAGASGEDFDRMVAARVAEAHAGVVAEEPAPMMLVDEREPECVKAWPGCYTFGHDPACCRFPKSCSAGEVRLVPVKQEGATDA